MWSCGQHSEEEGNDLTHRSNSPNTSRQIFSGSSSVTRPATSCDTLQNILPRIRVTSCLVSPPSALRLAPPTGPSAAVMCRIDTTSTEDTQTHRPSAADDAAGVHRKTRFGLTVTASLQRQKLRGDSVDGPTVVAHAVCERRQTSVVLELIMLTITCRHYTASVKEKKPDPTVRAQRAERRSPGPGSMRS